MNIHAHDRRLGWVIVASCATRLSVELSGVGLVVWVLILIGCWIARERLHPWLIVTVALANVLFAAAESHSSLFLVCATWFTCAVLGLLVLEQRRKRERAMLLQSTDPPARRTGSATFVLIALLCTVPLYLFLPKPPTLSIGGMQATATPKPRSEQVTPELPRPSESAAPLSALPTQEASLPPETTIDPARPEDGAYGDGFALDAVTRDKGRANSIVLYAKSSRPLNLRGQVYDRFENNRWHREPQSFEDYALERGNLELATPAFGADPIRQTIEVERTLDATLVHAPGVRRLRFPGADVRRYADDVFVVPNALQAQTTYSVESALTLMEDRYALAGRGAAPLAGYLGITELSSRQRDLALRVTQGRGGARAKALALEAFLRSEYEYSYESIAQQGYTPLDRFLFETKRGHCEYFASALAMLLRAVDVPSRVATGFSLSAPNPVTGYYEVRALDGHAWVEAFVDGYWMMLEPTPFYPLPPLRRDAQVADQLDRYLERIVQTQALSDPNSLKTHVARIARDTWQSTRAALRALAKIPTELGWIFPAALLLGAIAAACAYLALIAFTDLLANRALRSTLQRAAVTDGKKATLLTASALEGTATPRGVVRHASTSFREYLVALIEAGYAVPGAFADEFDVARYGAGESGGSPQSARDVREVIEQRLAADPWPRARRVSTAWRLLFKQS